MGGMEGSMGVSKKVVNPEDEMEITENGVDVFANVKKIRALNAGKNPTVDLLLDGLVTDIKKGIDEKMARQG